MTIKKKLISNFSYLTTIQLITLLVPFIYYPYIIRKFNIDDYGLVVFIQSIIMLLSIIVDFGFNIYATRITSKYSNNIKKLSVIYSSVTYIKIALFFLCLIVFQFFILFNNKLHENTVLSNLLFLIVLGEALFSQWLYLGLEKIKFAAAINLVSRIFLLLFILIGSNTSLGFHSFPAALIFSSLLNGILSIIFINNRLKIKFIPISFRRLKLDIVSSYSFLLSRSIGVIILKVNTYLIGNYIGLSYVAYYDLAEKLINLATLPLNMLNQVLYPHIAKTKNFNLTFKVVLYLFVLYILSYPILFFYGEELISIFAGNDMIKSYNYLVILYLVPITNIFTYFLGNCALILINKKKEFNNSIYISALFYFLIVLVSIYFFEINIIILCWSIVINSTLTCLYRINACIKYRELFTEIK